MSLPSWLRAIEHGELGEARVRAFLLERFWVLHRSVDVDGADHLVQVRPKSLERLVDAAIRLGRVQSKFAENESTTIYVPSSYVRDASGKPYGLFFVIVTTGETEASDMYLLSAEAIVRDFGLGSGDRGADFRIPARDVFRGTYSIQSRREALDTIERALVSADRLEYARFLRTHTPAPRPVSDDFELPLYHEYGSVPDGVKEIKRGVESALLDVDDIGGALQSILESDDPTAIEEILRSSAIKNFGGRAPDGDLKLSVQVPHVLNEEIFGAARDHRARVARLRDAGLTGAFVTLHSRVDGEVVRLLRARDPLGATKTWRWVLEFEPPALVFLKLAVEEIESPPAAGDTPPFGFRGPPKVSSGSVSAACDMGPYPPHVPRWQRPAPRDHPPDPPAWTTFVERNSRAVTDRLLRLVEAATFGDDSW